MGMKYYKIDNVPFATNAVPQKEAVEIDKIEHDALALASVKPMPIPEPVEDPLKEIRDKIEVLEDEVFKLKEAKE